MNILSTRRHFGSLAVLAALSLSGCAHLGSQTPEQQVEARALQYWTARAQGDYGKAYSLSAPSYRALRSAEQFRQQMGGGTAVKQAKVASVKCETERCVARMQLIAQPALIGMKLPMIETYVDEVWLLEEGQWWHYQDL